MYFNIELIGILGSVFVLLSFLMKDVRKIRIINIIGALLFVIYGMYINAFSTWFLNASLVCIHILYLIEDFMKNK